MDRPKRFKQPICDAIQSLLASLGRRRYFARVNQVVVLCGSQRSAVMSHSLELRIGTDMLVQPLAVAVAASLVGCSDEPGWQTECQCEYQCVWMTIMPRDYNAHGVVRPCTMQAAAKDRGPPSQMFAIALL